MDINEFLTLFNCFEILAFVVSILCLKWLWGTRYQYFAPYMLMTVLAEIGGRYTGYLKRYDWNNEIYNVSTVIEFLFFYYLFYAAIAKKVFKQLIKAFAVPYVIFVLLNVFFIQGFSQFNSYSMLVGTLLVITYVFFYFYDAFENNEPITLIREPMFWISIGIFLFYLGDFTFNLMYPYLQRNNLQRLRHLFHLINNNLIIFEYLCFSVALIICSRNRSVSKQPS